MFMPVNQEPYHNLFLDRNSFLVGEFLIKKNMYIYLTKEKLFHHKVWSCKENH